MSPLTRNKSDHQRLRQKIILLELLNGTPERTSTVKPTIQEAPFSPGTAFRRELDFCEEKKLAESFAFLAATTSDPRRVVATCVTEKAGEKKGLTVHLAANRGNLDPVKEKLEKLGGILQHVAEERETGTSNSKPDTQNELLLAAVRLNENRILLRLRSHHASVESQKDKERLKRTQIVKQLHQGLVSSKTTSPDEESTMRHVDLVMLENDVSTLRMLFQTLENLSHKTAHSAEGLNILVQIVTICHKIHRQKVLDSFLNRHADIDPSSKAALPKTISQIGHYLPVCTMLIKSARRHQSLFSQLCFEVVTVRGALVQENVGLDASVTKIIDRLLRQTLLPKAVQEMKSRTITEEMLPLGLQDYIYREAKASVPVHAEIQLLFHFDTSSHTSFIPPRIMCSSKQACFLCNLFFQAHGSFFVPGTHGRVYKNWTLPEFDATVTGNKSNSIPRAVSKFIAKIDEVILQEITSPREPFPFPHESMILFSTVASDMTVGLEDRRSLTPHSPTIDEISNLEKQQGNPTIPIEEGNSQPATSINCEDRNRNEYPASLSPVSTLSRSGARHTQSSKEDRLTTYAPLQIGHPLRFHLFPVPSQRESTIVRVSTPNIHLSISSEYSDSPVTTSSQTPSDVDYWVTVEYLSSTSLAQTDSDTRQFENVINNGGRSPIIQIGNSFHFTTLDYDTKPFPKTVHVRSKSDVVAITYCLNGPMEVK